MSIEDSFPRQIEMMTRALDRQAAALTALAMHQQEVLALLREIRDRLTALEQRADAPPGPPPA